VKSSSSLVIHNLFGILSPQITLIEECTMRNKTLLLLTLLIATGSVLAEQDLLGSAGKALLKDTATSAAPQEAVEGIESANQKLEDANKLKQGVKSVPDALNSQAQDMATESAKEKLNAAGPETTKKGIKTLESGTKTLKTTKGMIRKSSAEAGKAIEGKAQEEATSKALDMLK
jgi:hypothetical protein